MDLGRIVLDHWDRILGWAAITAGVLALVLGWWGVSGTAYPAAQLPYILSGGIGGIFLLGVGAVLLLTADLRDEWHKLDRLERRLAASTGDGTHHGGHHTDELPAVDVAEPAP